MKNVIAAIVVSVIYGLGSFAFSQAPTPSSALAAAIALLQQQKYADAADALEAIVKKEPESGPAWYQLAIARYYLKQYPAAEAAYEKNIPISGNPFAMYNLAGVYSLMGENKKAVEWLQKALDNPKMVAAAANFDDPDFANVKNDAGFLAIRDATDRKIRPCMYSDGAKQLNFWVGEWDVYNPQGRHDGTSSVQSFANGCGVLENWKGTIGGDGKSINFFDTNDHKWYQYWIGSGGGALRYSGAYSEKAMRYEGELIGADGKKTLTKLTFFDVDPNTVRQLAESSADGGTTWTTSYDYKYIRKK